jgi:branched-chain amino acid transport system permease protein
LGKSAEDRFGFLPHENVIPPACQLGANDRPTRRVFAEDPEMEVSEIILQTLLSGLLLGLIFSLVAVGLNLIFGVMDLVNFAHGEYLMLSMYIAYWLATLWGIDPLLSLPLCAGALFILGVATYRFLIARVMEAPMLAQIFATFGLMVFLQNVAFFLWKPDYRTVGKSLISGNFELLGAFVGLPQLVAAGGALITTGLVFFLINRTELGRALRATSENRMAASLMGIDTKRMFALAWGVGAACVGVAGALLSTFYPIFPQVGAVFGLTAFVVVVLGGFGSITGAFVAGIIIGLIQVTGGLIFAPAYKYAFVYALFLLVVFIRPQGLMGK